MMREEEEEGEEGVGDQKGDGLEWREGESETRRDCRN